MSQANMFASFNATRSEICADSAAWNRDESMVAEAVRICVCTGFSVTFAANPASSRTTCRVLVSLTLRDSSLTEPSRCVTLIASPGFR